MTGPYKLLLDERLGLPNTPNFGVDIDYTDLNGTAATTKILTLSAYAARHVIGGFSFDLITPFVGASITNLVLDVGYDGATVDLQTAFITGQELCAAGYRVADDGFLAAVDTQTVDGTYGTAESDVINSLRTRVNALRLRTLAAQETGNITALFTATGANLSALTAGKIRLFFRQHNLRDFRNVNAL